MMRILRVTILFLLTALTCHSVAAQFKAANKPEDAGFSSVRLQAVRSWLEANDTTAMMVIVDGKRVFEYGDVHKLSYLASARKSLLALLYGKYVQQGTIRLDKTLKEVGIDDVGGLSDQELSATILDVISARSGVYHPASNEGDATASAPPRNSQRPGSYFLYNNWDFNVAGTVFEKLTGKDIYDAFEQDLAKPIGMEDFDRGLQRRTGDPNKSKHLAYHFVLSTVDMARLGQLMLQGGLWNGVQVVPSEWIRRMTSLITPLNELEPVQNRALGTGERWGYGYMTWVWDAPGSQGPLVGAFQASGYGGQFITVVPSLKMVVAHKVDTFADSPHKMGKRFLQTEYVATLQMLINCRR